MQQQQPAAEANNKTPTTNRSENRERKSEKRKIGEPSREPFVSTNVNKMISTKANNSTQNH